MYEVVWSPLIQCRTGGGQVVDRRRTGGGRQVNPVTGPTQPFCEEACLRLSGNKPQKDIYSEGVFQKLTVQIRD